MRREEGERREGSLSVDAHEHDTVPVEEALIVNDAGQRRHLMLSVLNDSPAAYLDVLQAARLNDDVEVAHYAATAMAQISREGDMELQRLERAWFDRPHDAQVRDSYVSYLEEYLASGLAEGAAAQIQRRRYVELLEAQLADAQPGKGLPSRVRLVGALIDAGELTRAEQVAAETMQRYPRSEDAWMLRVRVAAARRDGAGVRSAIDELRASGVFISAPNREALAFWEQGAPNRPTTPSLPIKRPRMQRRSPADDRYQSAPRSPHTHRGVIGRRPGGTQGAGRACFLCGSAAHAAHRCIRRARRPRASAAHGRRSRPLSHASPVPLAEACLDLGGVPAHGRRPVR